MTDLPHSYNIRFGLTARVVQLENGKWSWEIRSHKKQVIAKSGIEHPERHLAQKRLERFLFKVRHDSPPVRIEQ